MRQLGIIFIVAITILATGCNQGKVKRSLLPGVSGNAGEVLVIMDKEKWNGSPGELVRDLLLQDVPGLPQSEPLFNTVNISNRAFSALFRIHRNIVITKISSEIEKPVITVERDKWAEPQTVIYIMAPSRETFLNLFNQNTDKVLGLLLKAERDRLMNNYKKYAERPVIEKLKRNTGIHLTIPKGYTYDLDTNNFIWISHETPQISQGLFVYSYEYKDTSDFNQISLINKRNEFLQNYVAGPRKGSYMTTELQYLPTFRSYEWKGQYTAELRGLWKVEGDYMGGPFVSLSRLDKVNNRVVTVEGYVYAPKYDKRKYIRQMEAILYSFDFEKKK